MGTTKTNRWDQFTIHELCELLKVLDVEDPAPELKRLRREINSYLINLRSQ